MKPCWRPFAVGLVFVTDVVVAAAPVARAQPDWFGLAIREAVVLVWGGLAWSVLRAPAPEGEPYPRGLVFTVATGLALLLLVTLPPGVSEWAAIAAVLVPLIAGELWADWRQGQAQEAAYRAQVRERHQRALAAGVGLALPRRLAKLRPDLARACPACAEMHALWNANRKLSVEQAEAIVERQIVLGNCPPHAAWRDE